MRNVAAAALVVALSATATAQVAILQIQVIEGEGEVHPPGSRSPRPLTVAIADEMNRPVAGAAVSFHLPEEGPSAVFANGLRSEVVTADQRGHAGVRGLRWNRVPGTLQIRIIASKEQARAGILSVQYIAGPEATTVTRRAPGRSEPTQKASRGRARWIAVMALIGSGAAAGVLAARGGRESAPVPAAAAVTTPTVTIGPPTITVGKP